MDASEDAPSRRCILQPRFLREKALGKPLPGLFQKKGIEFHRGRKPGARTEPAALERGSSRSDERARCIR